jgi:hypothetical protein
LRHARHGPNRFLSYKQIHDTCLRNFFDSGFLLDQTLEWSALPGEIELSGQLLCLGGIVIGVRKVLEVVEDHETDPLVQTVEYAYNAHLSGHGNFLRCDNSHAHPGHETDNHRHEWDYRTEEDLPGSPRCTGIDWPLLSEFIADVETWYWSHAEELPEPAHAVRLLGKR